MHLCSVMIVIVMVVMTTLTMMRALACNTRDPSTAIAQRAKQKSPTVGLEPTTTRLRALRSAD